MEKASEGMNLHQRESQLEGAKKVRATNKYTTPHLVEYGSLKKLTRAKVTGITDASMTQCL